jgi:hypothetical protein
LVVRHEVATTVLPGFKKMTRIGNMFARLGIALKQQFDPAALTKALAL